MLDVSKERVAFISKVSLSIDIDLEPSEDNDTSETSETTERLSVRSP